VNKEYIVSAMIKSRYQPVPLILKQDFLNREEAHRFLVVVSALPSCYYCSMHEEYVNDNDIAGKGTQK